MERSKADFRALRETVGMGQAYLAYKMGVERRSVRRWESPNAPQMPPLAAWNVLDEARNRQKMAVGYALEKIEELDAEFGKAEEISLIYYFTQESYDEAHPLTVDEGDYAIANANTRIVANEAENRGYTVHLDYV